MSSYLRQTLTFITAVAALALTAAACGPAVQFPELNQAHFAKATVFASRGNVTAANYRVDAAIPCGSAITVLAANPKVIVFRVEETGQQYNFTNHDRASGTDTLGAFQRFFGPDDPAPKLAALDDAKREAVIAGTTIPGMTREEALMAMGPPPLNETPDTGADSWRYWQNRFKKITVHFQGGVVVAEAAPAPAPAREPLEELFARCNVHHEGGVVSWVNYLRGPVVPVGTRIEVLDKGRKSVEFRLAESGIELEFENDEDKSGQATWPLFTRLFAPEPPTARLDGLDEETRGRVLGGEVVEGMSKEAVELAWCPPPPHETPSLEASTWTYWTIRFNRKQVVFEKGVVARIKQ